MTQLPILYSFRRCPYAMRARLAIAVSGTKVELREILLRDKPPELLEASPKATVPVLIEANGNVLEESLDIMHWALEKNDPDKWLSPEIGSLEEMQALISECDNEFKPHLDHYKYANRYEGIDARQERELASIFLLKLNARLEQEKYLFGSRISLADMAIATFVRQFANVDRNWFDGQEWTNLRNWLEAFLESERFLGIMEKYAKWMSGGEAVLFKGVRSTNPTTQNLTQ